MSLQESLGSYLKGADMNTLSKLSQPVAELSLILQGKYGLTKRCSTVVEQVLLGMTSLGLELEDAHIFVDDILCNIEFDGDLLWAIPKT